MANVLVYYAHPGHKHSHTNRAMLAEAQNVPDVSVVDLYARYPRFDIDVAREQRRLIENDVIVFQFPLFWYSTPSLVKEWQDLVLEHGFAYGSSGDRLSGKRLQVAITAAGSSADYQPDGYQNHSIRTFLTPLEQTARLCQMRFLPPYVLFQSLLAPTDGRLEQHALGYRRLLEALRDERFAVETARSAEYLCADTLPIAGGAR